MAAAPSRKNTTATTTSKTTSIPLPVAEAIEVPPVVIWEEAEASSADVSASLLRL